MTLGQQKGARVNQAIIKEAEESAPWLGRIQARFGSDGLLTGVTLTPEQIHAMVALGTSSLTQSKRKFQAVEDYHSAGRTGGNQSPAAAPSNVIKYDKAGNRVQ